MALDDAVPSLASVMKPRRKMVKNSAGDALDEEEMRVVLTKDSKEDAFRENGDKENRGGGGSQPLTQ